MKRIALALLLGLLLLTLGYIFTINSKQPKVGYDEHYPRVTASLKSCASSPTWSDCLLGELELNGEINGYNSSSNYLETLISEPSYSAICHNLSHQLGYKAFQHYKSFEFFNQNTKPGCQGGFIHGLFEQAGYLGYKISSINFCEESKFYSDCKHAYGHYLFILHKGLSESSVNECAKTKYASDCLDGLFMANSLLNHSASVKLYQLCANLEQWAQPACYRNSFYGIGSAVFDDLGGTTVLEELCSKLSVANAKACKEGVGYGSRSILNNTSDSQLYIELCTFGGERDAGCLNYVLMQNQGIREYSFYQDICSLPFVSREICRSSGAEE